MAEDLMTEELSLVDRAATRFSTRLARSFERRRFLRQSAKTAFYGGVAVSSGVVSLSTFLADPASAAGPCCPTGCGPAPCCDTSCCTSHTWIGACCAGPAGTNSKCNAGSGSSCDSYDFRFYTDDACWFRDGSHCCDCTTKGSHGKYCPYTVNRCICSRPS